jgi:hypothetical protein
MKSRRNNWVSGIGAFGLAVGCLVLAGFVSGATPAAAATSENPRFTVLESMNGEGVLDNETGLIWETIPTRAMTVWKNAAGICAKKTVGGKKDWRLPSLKELETLADHTIYPPPARPSLFQHRVSWLLDVDGARRLFV